MALPPQAAANDILRFGEQLLNEMQRNSGGRVIRRLDEDEIIRRVPDRRQQRSETRRQQRKTQQRSAESGPRGNPTVYRLQQFLIANGFNPGEPDGDWGRATEQALKDWQASIDNEPTGVLTDPQRMTIFGTTDPAGTKTAEQPAQPMTAPARVAAATPQGGGYVQVNRPGYGVWYGRMACKRDRETLDTQFEFDIATRKDGYYELTLALYRPNDKDGHVTYTTFLGEDIRGKEGTRNFVVSKRDNDIGAITPGNFTLTGDIFGSAPLEAAFSSGPCPSFAAEHYSAWGSRMTPTAAIPVDGGTFVSLPTWRDRCEALIGWMDKLTVEYPGHDFLKGDRSNHRRTLPLFADDDFLPVFGQAFDALNEESRRKIWDEIGDHCERDPFTRDRMRIYNYLIEGRFREYGVHAPMFGVREIRKIRNEVRALAQQAAAPMSGDRPFRSVAGDLIAVREQIAAKSTQLWPSETKDAAAAIDARIQTLARAEADKALAATQAASDPASGLKLAGDALSNDRFGFLAQMAAADRDQFTRAIEELQAGFAEQLFAPELSKASAAPRDLGGVRQIAEQLKAVPAITTGIPDTPKQKFIAALTTERDKRLVEIVDRRIAELTALPPGLAGLSAGATWADTLKADFAGFSDNAALKKAEGEFGKDRQRRLKEALPEFEARARSMANQAEAAALVDQYFSMPSDKRETVWLEYMFAANAVGS
ncbi:peptidoglycan-binding domain-containing protein [Mesorhizobium australicum]|uniref:peptidoglycan-binding domain-containing protein n=1 Tax=Mesorhizobium australicum TaxID=536018 RepID=UPI001593D4D1|nr:peptidoglycan-binding domain-containing protein [Mesorhizobium australicum]